MPTGDTFSGSMSWTTGQQAESRWIFIDSAGQQSRTLTVSATGPTNPTMENMIKTDRPLSSSLGLHIKTTKTAHVDGTSFSGTGGLKRIWAWCAGDESSPCQLTYGGAGSALPWIHQQSTVTASLADFHANAAPQNGEPGGAVSHSLLMFGRGINDLWVTGFGIVGFQLQFQPITAQVFTGVNTWLIELEFLYG